MDNKNIQLPKRPSFAILKDVFGSFALSRLLVLCVGYFSYIVINRGKWVSSPVHIFFRWDAGWYLDVVNNGYSYVVGKESSIAFFPLYPILVKVFSFGIFDLATVGYVISNALLFLAGLYLYKLITLDFDNPQIASNAVLCMMLCPLSFFFSIFYSEATFLFFSIGCFYYAVKKRWLVASLFGFCLALTKNVGVIMFIPLLMEYFDIHDIDSLKFSFTKIKVSILSLLLVPAGLFSFMAYQYIKFQDAFAFVHAQYAWGRRFSSIFTTLSSVKNYGLFSDVLFIGVVVVALALIAYLAYSKVRLSYVVYSALLLFIFLSANLLESIPRYISVIFPLYLGVSLLGAKSDFVRTLALCFSVSLLTFLTILFANGYWLT